MPRIANPERTVAAVSQLLLPIGLASCGPSQAQVEACKSAPVVRNHELRAALGMFYQTDLGKKYKAMTPAQLAAHSQDYPELKGMDAIIVFNAQIEGIERRYWAERKRCAEKGL